MRFLVPLLLLALVAAACAGEDPEPAGDGSPTTSPVTTAPVTTSPVTTAPVTTSPVTTSPVEVPEALAGRDLTTISVDGRELLVAVADDAGERAAGLQHVADLGSLDGMLFAYAEDVQKTFWMKDVLIPLDILFFDASGSFVDAVSLRPCSGEPCDEYEPVVAFRYVVETAAGELAGFGPGTVLDLG